MSYSPTTLWTLLACLLLAGALHAQDRALMREVSRLSSPTSWERADAIEQIAEWPGDIGSSLRVAYRFASRVERIGLLNAAARRLDSALLLQAAEALSDDGVRGTARDYLLSLPADELTPDEDSLDADQRNAWHEFRKFRLRRDISLALLDAHLKPGKFFGQFDDLRSRDSDALDGELLALLAADPAFREPLITAARARIEQGIDAHRVFSPSWRGLRDGFPAIDEALNFLSAAEDDRAEFIEGRLPVALTLINDLRAAAARALAMSDSTEKLVKPLHAAYEQLLGFRTEARLRQSASPERILKELEITLARFGRTELLEARIERMRASIQRFQGSAAANVHLRHAARPDLIAQHEIAHLLLRAGKAESAEQEWMAALAESDVELKEADPRRRQALVSFRAATFYNLACAQALQLKLSRSLESMQSAVENGYRDFSWMLEDGDLVHVRRTPEFRAWFLDVAPPAVADLYQSRQP